MKLNGPAVKSDLLFSDAVHVHYGQFYVEPQDGEYIDMAAAFRNQSNGICGAAQPGRLFLITGIHTGTVHVAVELLDGDPPVDPSWEEIVESSFIHEHSSVRLCEWAHEAVHALELPKGIYRVRYSAKAMLGDWQLTQDDGPLQHYLLQFWPAPYADDKVVKVFGECARYWHAEVTKRRRED